MTTALFLIALAFMVLWLMGMADGALAASARRDARKRRERSPRTIVRSGAASPPRTSLPPIGTEPDRPAPSSRQEDEEVLAIGSRGEVLAFEYYLTGGKVTTHHVVNWIEYPRHFGGYCRTRRARHMFRKDQVLEWIGGRELLVDPDGYGSS